MKHLFLILSAVVLFSCSTEQEQKPVVKTSPLTCGYTFAATPDSIYPGDNYDTIAVSGLLSPYQINQIDYMEIEVDHPNMSDISISLLSPQGAQWFATDMELITSNFYVDLRAFDIPVYTSANQTYYNYGSPVNVNGDWVVYTYNGGLATGYLSQFDITFNF